MRITFLILFLIYFACLMAIAAFSVLVLGKSNPPFWFYADGVFVSFLGASFTVVRRSGG